MAHDHIAGTIYLLHFNNPHRHAKHYLGWALNYKWVERIEQHKKGTGAVFFRNLVRAGADISFVLARTWENKDRFYERKLKQTGKARFCPVCKALKARKVSDDNNQTSQTR